MLPDPLHPIVVHFPIVLSILLPVAAALALWAIRGGARPTRAWSVAIAFALALTVSSWVAVETGEDQEERVESVVGESKLDAHASAGEALLITSVGVLAALALGLMPGNAGRVARYVGAVGTLTVAAASFRVGMTGGDLVYKHNAASAYATADTTRAGRGNDAGRAVGEKDEKSERTGAERREKGER